jgi:hypothetical protein
MTQTPAAFSASTIAGAPSHVSMSAQSGASLLQNPVVPRASGSILIGKSGVSTELPGQ